MTLSSLVYRVAGPLALPFYRNSSKTFLFNGKPLRYLAHIHNAAHFNERTIEVPIAQEFVQNARSILEVGNVLNHYARFPHDVIDKFEKAEGVLNIDARAFRPARRYDLIVSISTLEHIGLDGFPKGRPSALEEAIANLRSLLTPDGKMVFTVPIGYNLWLDDKLHHHRLCPERVCFRRLTRFGNAWEQCDFEDIAQARYGSPFHAANGIVVGVIYCNTQ